MTKLKSIRWWDGAALIMALVIALFVVRYAMQKSGTIGTTVESKKIVVRVPNPLAEVIQQVQAGDQLLNEKNESIGKILAVNQVLSTMEPASSLFGKQDSLITIAVNGNLRLKRNLPAFPLEPGSLKAGVWCLLTTDKVEVAGMIIKIDTLSRAEAD